MSVLAVMKNLRSEVDAGSIRPYCFVEINGLKLASPENIYRVKIIFRPAIPYRAGMPLLPCNTCCVSHRLYMKR